MKLGIEKSAMIRVRAAIRLEYPHRRAVPIPWLCRKFMPHGLLFGPGPTAMLLQLYDLLALRRGF
jgi:hypothetical protein